MLRPAFPCRLVGLNFFPSLPQSSDFRHFPDAIVPRRRTRAPDPMTRGVPFPSEYESPPRRPDPGGVVGRLVPG